jgi:TonB family protein
MRRGRAILILAITTLATTSLRVQAQNDPSAVLRVGNGVSPPKVIVQPEPEYSEKARVAGYEGICTLALIVEADGKPSHIRVTNPLGMGLDEKAIEAVRNWRFQPALKNGQPVAVQIAVELEFHLYPNNTSKMAQLKKKASDGEPKAEFELAKVYFEGKFLPKDEHYGMVLLERASNRGFAQAQFELAERMMHADSPDYAKAYMWYTLAQRGGEKHSGKALKKLTAQISPDQLQAGKSLVESWTPTRN